MVHLDDLDVVDMQTARVPDCPVRHDESVTTQNGERRQQIGL